MRAHRRPRPCSGCSPKCHGGARRAQRSTSTGKSLLTTPFPKPHVRQSVVARAEDACRVWEGLSSGCGTSDSYQTPQKAISVFFVPPSDLLLEDPVVGRPTPPWAPRRGRRDPDIDSGLARVCFVRIWGRSCVVPTWPSGGVVSSQHRCAPIDDARAGRVWWDRVVALSLGRAQHRPGGRRGDESSFSGVTPPSKTYQQHALARGCSGLWRSRAVRAPVGDATAPFRWRTCSTDGGASCWSHDGPSSLVLRCHGWRRSSNHTRSLRSSCAPFGGGPPRAAMPQHDGTASPRRARKTRRVPLRSQAVRPSLH
jgi:hypothetical protein